MKYFTLLILVTILALLFPRMQYRMIYYPRGYSFNQLPGNIIELQFTTTAGKQSAFYYPPPENTTGNPEKIWFIFGGNATLALDWYDFVKGHPDKKAGFLLMDYPGYGNSQGKASPKTILQSSEKALETLAVKLNLPVKTLAKKLHILGHSLGAAAALQFAVLHPAQKLVLVSPFTTMQDMAVLVVGKFLSKMLLQNFDNRARLRELAERSSPPSITIFHGSNDEIIPVSMGRELARLHPNLITYHEIDKAGHNYIFSIAEAQIYEAMQSD